MVHLVKKILVFVVVICALLPLFGEVAPNYRHVKTWRIDERFGVVDSIPVDSAPHNFQDDNPIDKNSIANSYNGNLGSPIQAKLYFDRPENKDFIFSNAYVPYIKNIRNTTFYNTKTPYSMLHYISGGSTFKDQDLLKFFFTANANKKLNFGVTIDYSESPGEYANQGSKRNNATLFGSYNGKHYTAYGTIFTNEHYNKENGGLDNPRLIDSTQNQFFSSLKTKINGESKYNQMGLFYNHQYTIGFDKTKQINKDSVATEYVPVTRFAHTLKIEDSRRHYYENSPETGFYANTYFKSLAHTRDTCALQTVTNTVSISMAEEFNKLFRFGLTAFAENENLNYTSILYQDSTIHYTALNSTKVGGILSKNQGRVFKYNVLGELTMLGYKAGDFRLEGNIGGFFKLWKDSVTLVAKGFSRSDATSFLLQEFASNHFKWNNQFGKTNRTHVSGTLAIPTRQFSFSLGVENIAKYIYFNEAALPTQFNGSIQVISANLKQRFKVGVFGLENNIVYQKASQPSILPLPEITVLENLYYEDKWFKVMTMQIGVNLRFHTAYYAPSYMPAIGQFYNQSKELIGSFPLASAYVNFHLKRVRFYIEYYHFDLLFVKNEHYFSMPNYPITPALIKTGISWCFYD
jgi:Putative porin